MLEVQSFLIITNIYQEICGAHNVDFPLLTKFSLYTRVDTILMTIHVKNTKSLII